MVIVVIVVIAVIVIARFAIIYMYHSLTKMI